MPSRHSRPLSKRVRHRLYILSQTYGWVTKFVLMMWLLESVLGLVVIWIAGTTGVLFGGPAGALAFVACWVVTGTPVYYWNKARKTGRTEGFDDRLTDARMAKGRAEVLSQFEKQRQEEAAEEQKELDLTNLGLEDQKNRKDGSQL